MQQGQQRINHFKGMNLLVPPEMLPPEYFLLDQNGDRRRGMSWRVRPGYRRLFSGQNSVTASLLFTDTFSRTDTLTIDESGSWVSIKKQEAGSSELEMKSTVYRCRVWDSVDAGFEQAVYCRYADTVNADNHEVEWILDSDGASASSVLNRSCGGIVRATTTQAYLCTSYGALYHVTYDSGDGTPTLTLLGSFSGTFAPGDVWKMRAVGSTISVYVNGTLKLSVTNTTISSGLPGIYGFSLTSATEFDYDEITTARIRNISTAAQSTKVAGIPRRIMAFERDDNEAQIVVSHPGILSAFETGTPEGT